jgi:hypothetical protein
MIPILITFEKRTSQTKRGVERCLWKGNNRPKQQVSLHLKQLLQETSNYTEKSGSAMAHSAYSKWTHVELAKTSLTGETNENIKHSAI